MGTGKSRVRCAVAVLAAVVLTLAGCGSSGKSSVATSAVSASGEEWSEKTKVKFEQECETLGHSARLCPEALKSLEQIEPKAKLNEAIAHGTGIKLHEAPGDTPEQVVEAVWREYVESSLQSLQEHGLVHGE